jgi:hypothetical protein
MSKFKVLGVFIVGIMTVAGALAAIWSVMAPDQKAEYLRRILDKQEEIRLAIVTRLPFLPQPVASPSQSAPTPPDASPTPTLMPTLSSSDSVPMDKLSSESNGIAMTRARYANILNGTSLHIRLQVTSSHVPWKIFVVSWPDGWSISSEKGYQCGFLGNLLTGIQIFSLSDYENRLPEMAALPPGRVMTVNAIANCNHVLSETDRVDITVQLHALPEAAMPGNRDSKNMSVVNFTSNAIALEQ